MIEFRKRTEGFWNLWWDTESYPNFKFVTARVLGFCKKRAYDNVEIYIDEQSFLFKVPFHIAGGLYEAGFPNTPEVIAGLRNLLTYAESIQTGWSPDERQNTLQLLKREKYID